MCSYVCLQALLESGASIEKTVAGNPPLHFALQMLLVDSSDKTSTENGTSVGSAILDCLLDHGALVHAINDRGQSALHIAASNGLDDVLMKLINKLVQTEEQPAADPETNGMATKPVTLVISREEALNAKDRTGSTPLHMAASWGHKGCVFSLIESGAHTQAINKRGENALHVAAAAVRLAC